MGTRSQIVYGAILRARQWLVMSIPVHSPHTFRFGAFEVDLETGELHRNGRKIHLQEKPFQVLVALLQQQGMLVTREALRQQLWPEDTFVDFDNGLNTAVSKLRLALGDTAGKHSYIETLGRRGYRFVASVQELGVRPAAQLRDLEVRRNRIEPDVVLVQVVGKIVHGSECQQIEWLIAALLGDGEKKIIFDISQVSFLDSAGVGILVMSCSKAKEVGGELRVAGAQGRVQTILEKTKVEKIVPLYPTVAEALNFS